MKTAELKGAALDAAVARALGWVVERGLFWATPALPRNEKDEDPEEPEFDLRLIRVHSAVKDWSPSTNWAIAGPIIEREGIAIARYEYETPPDQRWRAGDVDGGAYFSSLDLRYAGPTPLIAAMRAYVASRLGEEVVLP